MTDLNDLLAVDADTEEVEDNVGGGASYIKESDVYMVKINHAFFEESSGGAQGVNISMNHSKENGGSEFNTTVYVTSGKAKGQKNFYLDKEGKKRLLPGYITVDELCIVASGKPMRESTMTTKAIQVYDFSAGKKVSKEVPVLDALTGAIVQLGIKKVLVNKYKDGAPTSEETERNEISKAFTKDFKSAKEFLAKADAEKIEEWKTKNVGITKDDRTIKGSGGSSHAAPASTESSDDTKGLF